MATQLKESAESLHKSVEDLAIFVGGNTNILGTTRSIADVSRSLDSKNLGAKVLSFKSDSASQQDSNFADKKVSGSDIATPSGDDPRFEDL